MESAEARMRAPSTTALIAALGCRRRGQHLAGVTAPAVVREGAADVDAETMVHAAPAKGRDLSAEV